jgi:hypothetical protein
MLRKARSALANSPLEIIAVAVFKNPFKVSPSAMVLSGMLALHICFTYGEVNRFFPDLRICSDFP